MTQALLYALLGPLLLGLLGIVFGLVTLTQIRQKKVFRTRIAMTNDAIRAEDYPDKDANGVPEEVEVWSRANHGPPFYVWTFVVAFMFANYAIIALVGLAGISVRFADSYFLNFVIYTVGSLPITLTVLFFLARYARSRNDEWEEFLRESEKRRKRTNLSG